MLDKLVDFIKMCSKWDLQIRVRAGKKTSGRWEEGYKNFNTANNTISAPKSSPVGCYT
jgi:hypothetical protein